jgi:hypothetical protein
MYSLLDTYAKPRPQREECNMVNTTFTNLTDASRLIKADPDTSFPKSVKQAQAA